MVNYNVTVIIPSLNPDEKLLKTVCELEENGFDDIIIVDDGSDKEYTHFFPNVDEHRSCTLIRHRVNRGKGGALKTAFRYYLKNRTDRVGVVTIDGDGQHLVKDIINTCNEMIESGEVVLGCRDFSLDSVPRRSKFGNNTTKAVFRLFCGLNVSDTQTGLRAIPNQYLKDIVSVSGNRYEYETNMLLEFKKRSIPFREVKIDTVYIDDNKSSHFNTIIDSFRIYKLIFAFMFSSFASTLIDQVSFYIILKFLFKSSIFCSAFVARIISATANYIINRKKVFKSKDKISKSFSRYVVLAVGQIAVSSLFVKLLTLVFGVKAPFLTTLFKIIVDTVLFLVSFRIQQGWVFAPEKKYQKTDESKEQETKKISTGCIVRRVLLCVGTTLLYVVCSLLILLNICANGPSKSLRNKLVLSAKQASATKWVPHIFLSDETVDEIVNGSYVDNTYTVDINANSSSTETDSWDNAIDGMKYITLNKSGFKAYILLVKDPSRVYVGSASDDFVNAPRALNVFDMAKKENAIAMINGGEYLDTGGFGNGLTPIGMIYSKGRFLWNDNSRRTFIGIDNNNKLIVRESMTKAEADRLGIRDAVSFQTGNVLIDSDGSVVNYHYKPGNTGAAQRSAIGQTADGTFIFIATDGRTASSIGATYDNIIDIFASYGAVNAAMLDGGSSVVMYYENYFDKYKIDKSTLDEYQLRGLTNVYKAFTNPRTIPTYFCISR